MEFPIIIWRMSVYGAVKVNVHGFFSDKTFPNGNRSGIGWSFVIIEATFSLSMGFLMHRGKEDGRVVCHVERSDKGFS